MSSPTQRARCRARPLAMALAAFAAPMIAALAGLPGGTALAQAGRVEQLHVPPRPPFEIPRPQRVVLDNGMVVMLLEDHELPLVTVTALLRAGARLDPPAKLGLAAIAGEVMRSGGIARAVRPRQEPPARAATRPSSPGRPPRAAAGAGDDAGALSGDALDELLESRAAELEVGFGEDSGRASLSVLEDDFARLLPLFAAVLRYPAFDAAKLGLAKGLAKARLARENDDPDELLTREFARLVYGPRSVYGRTPTFATVDAIGRGDLLAWHRRHVQPEGIVLGVVGDFQAARALAAIRAAFADWQRGPAPPSPPGPDAFSYRREPHPGLFVVDKSDMSQAEVIMGHLGVRKSDPDYFALQVVDEVLSGSFASRLVAHVRTDKGLAYAVEGGIGSDWDHPGLAALSLSTRSANAAAGVAALLAEARDLTAEPPTEEEVARAKQSILASFVFQSDSPAKVLAQQLTFELFGYPLDWLARYRTAVEAVTTAEVRRAAARHLHPDQLTILVVGPAASADRALAAFGKPTVLPLPDPAAGGR